MDLIRRLDRFSNAITMYRLVQSSLRIIVGVAIALAVLGVLPFSPLALAASLGILVLVCWVANYLCATIVGAVTNTESYAITAMILFCIVPPPTDIRGGLLVAATGLIAMASKYILAIRAKHIFNPAAIAVVIMGISGVYPATWWIATGSMLPVILILGFLIIRKTRRFRLVSSFLVATFVVLLGVGAVQGQAIPDILAVSVVSWPVFFFASIMLTEPSTMPRTDRDQAIFGVLVGLIFASQTHIGRIYSSPEVALAIGNIFAYFVSPKYRLKLRLKEQIQRSPSISEFVFIPDRPIQFSPGQYLEFTLPHAKPDRRGNRRTFSIASAPGETQLRLGIKFNQPSSTFKQALRALRPGSIIVAGQLAGTFILPRAHDKKLLFIAGGIGITPFRSMVQDMINRQAKRDIILYYAVADAAEATYLGLFQQAAPLGVKVSVATSPIPVGELRSAADGREVYISGPSAMVDHYRGLLASGGHPKGRIHADYFSGY